MRQNIGSIKAMRFDNSIAKSMLTNFNEIIRFQNQLSQSSISNVITKRFAAELAKNSNLLANQFKFAFPEIRIPVDLFALQHSSGLLALQAIRHNQSGQVKFTEDIISRINTIGDQARQGEIIDERAIDIIIQTLGRMEETLIALQTNAKSNELKLLTIEDIRFYFNLILSLALFIIPYIG